MFLLSKCVLKSKPYLSSTLIVEQLVISQPPGTVASAVIGILSGQLYRADIIGLKAFRLPMALQRFSSRFLLPLIGSTKPQRRSNRAFPDEGTRSRRPALFSQTQSLENTEVVSDSVPAFAGTNANGEDGGGTEDVSSGAGIGGAGTSTGSSAANAAAAGQSMVRGWVDELTGRTDRTATGVRVPAEAEISQVMSMFPDMRREEVVGALQRRYVQCLLGCDIL